MLKSVTCGPAGTDLSSVCTTWPSWKVQRAVTVDALLPSVATEAWMVSALAKLVPGLVTLWSAHTALPRSTLEMISEFAGGVVVAIGPPAVLAAGGATVVAGAGMAVLAAPGIVAPSLGLASCFLQPASATPAHSATTRTVGRVWNMACSLLSLREEVAGPARDGSGRDRRAGRGWHRRSHASGWPCRR